MCVIVFFFFLFFFFFNDTATTEIYTLSLHDALPIYGRKESLQRPGFGDGECRELAGRELTQLVEDVGEDRKSTRLNSSHDQISYAVFCLKKKKYSSSAQTRQDATTSKPSATSSNG